MSEEDRGGCFEMSMVEPRPLDSVFASEGAGVSEVGIMAAPTTLFELRWTVVGDAALPVSFVRAVGCRY